MFPSYILICLGTQMLYAYLNHEIVIETSLVSGKDIAGKRTNPGFFHIYEKCREMKFAHYWMAFDAKRLGSGIHDNLKRVNDLSQFGGEIFREKGSIGCIHVPLDVSRKLFGLYDLGTPVIVAE